MSQLKPFFHQSSVPTFHAPGLLIITLPTWCKSPILGGLGRGMDPRTLMDSLFLVTMGQHPGIQEVPVEGGWGVGTVSVPSWCLYLPCPLCVLLVSPHVCMFCSMRGGAEICFFLPPYLGSCFSSSRRLPVKRQFLPYVLCQLQFLILRAPVLSRSPIHSCAGITGPSSVLLVCAFWSSVCACLSVDKQNQRAQIQIKSSLHFLQSKLSQGTLQKPRT